MEEKEFITRSARETEDLGSKLAHNFRAGDIILLHGELGAGKTTFVQGVAKAFNIKSRIISPTFILVRKHKARIRNHESPARNASHSDAGGRIMNLYHIDLYRLDSSQDIQNLGLEDVFEDSNGVFFIEWGEKHGNLKASFEINFEILGRSRRQITLRQAQGKQ